MFRWRSFVLLLGLGSAASAVACGLVTSGIPGASGSGGGTGSGSSSAGGQGGSTTACPDCETLPAGWTLVRAQRVDAGISVDAGDAGDPSDGGDAGDASDTSPPPVCADGTAAKVYFYGPAVPACGACTCGELEGASCSAPQITCSYSTLDCSTNDIQIQDATPNCSTDDPGLDYLFGNSSGSCQLTAAGELMNAGTCAATGGGVTPESPFQGNVVVCPAPADAAGCSDGRSCLPSGTTADGALCITRPDDTPCPAGWTSDVIPAFEGATDTRACPDCACDIQCQGGGYVVYTQDFCIDGTKVTVDSTTCTKAPGIFDYSSSSFQSTQATPTLAACKAPTPSGIVAPTGVHQICCR